MSPAADATGSFSTTEKDAYFHTLRDLEQLHTSCTNKGTLLKKVVAGSEAVTFPMIDRCREALLQLRQSHHVFTVLHARCATHALADHARLTELMDSNKAVVDDAMYNITTILSWVPPAPNTRRTDGQAAPIT